MTRLFKLDDTYSVVCESQGTRNGFRHVAVLLRGGYEVSRCKISYLNRTWERFEFESVLNKTLDYFKDTQERLKYKKVIAEFN